MGWNQSWGQGYSDAKNGIVDKNGSPRYKEGQAAFEQHQKEDQERFERHLQEQADRRSKRGLFG